MPENDHGHLYAFLGLIGAALITGYFSLVAAGKVDSPFGIQRQPQIEPSATAATRAAPIASPAQAPKVEILPPKPTTMASDDILKQQYDQRARESAQKQELSKQEAIKKAVAASPWCSRCQHYHPPDARGCPTGPATHRVCGTKHWMDEVCPVYGFRIPPPGAKK